MAIDINVLSQGLVRVAGFIVIIVLSLVVGRVGGKLVERLLHEFELNRFVRKKGKKLWLEEVIGAMIRYGIYILGIVLALNYVGLGPAIYRLIIAVILLFAIILITLNIGEFIPNVIAKLTARKLHNGEKVEFDGIKGEVIGNKMTAYRIRTLDNDIIELPYSKVNKLLGNV